MAPIYGLGSTVSRLQTHHYDTGYFLPLSPQEFWYSIDRPSNDEGQVNLGATKWF